MRVFKHLIAALACVATVAALAACGGSDDSSGGDAGSPSAAAPAPTERPARAPERLVIRVWSGEIQRTVAATAGRAFTRDTGIPITWDTTDEEISYAKLGQEIRAGDRPSADASFNAQQRAYTSGARGQTIAISPRVAPNLDAVNAETAKPEGADDEGWPYVNVWSLSVPFLVRSDRVDPADVRSWDALKAPELRRGLLVDSLYSSLAFGVADVLGVDPAENQPEGMDPVWDWVEGLRPNLAVLGANADAVTALTDGSVKVAINASFTGVEARNAGAPVELVAPDEGLYVVGDAYYVHKGIPQENAYYAQVFANYLLEADAQSAFARALGLIPVNPDASVPRYMRDQPEVFPRTPEQLRETGAVVAPIPLMARNDAAWQEAYDNALK